jgi:intracellular sulfur oxidation DsrE/DsrF family protein
MYKNTAKTLLIVFAFFIVLPAVAQQSTFKHGPVFEKFGMTAEVPTHTVSEDAKFNVAFDVARAGKEGELNIRFESLARFINMHVKAGVKQENIRLALVVHGSAIFDLLNNESYQKEYLADNANQALVLALLQNNVRVIMCGQSAASRKLDVTQLVDGVEVELSAMTAHALLQQEGYTVNPF